MSIKIGSDAKNVVDVVFGTSSSASKNVDKVVDWNGNIVWQRNRIVDIGECYVISEGEVNITLIRGECEPFQPCLLNFGMIPDDTFVAYSQQEGSTVGYDIRPYATCGDDVTGTEINGLLLRVPSETNYRTLKQDVHYRIEYENYQGTLTVSDQTDAKMKIIGIEEAGYTGSIELSYKITATTFSPPTGTHYKITANIKPWLGGIVTGSGSYPAYSSCTLLAVSYPGYHFKEWDDGNKTNPRTVTVISNKTFTATFVKG